ncbi:DOPA 45-dioxygenase [Caballeronia sordidicola]|uniref:DOPA 45-dioxygenase n=1 Tax=Caballeronia sordidicola TaxID=196367 RepID=A0A158EQ92_CABSO|nr:DOPA 4,5-dioxygenase family protein [Caballeronia sordidicola]SAL09666.1 DOPA 45-dioxygenase [Caballeronia sordidicola]
MFEKIPMGAPRASVEEVPIRSIKAVQSYHAHIYFDGPKQKRIAEVLRENIAQRFAVLLGRWHDSPIGPHARPMYQVAFAPNEFGRFVPWLMVNRQELTVLVHPNTGHPKADHLDHPIWMGVALEILNLHLLPEREGPEPQFAPNTQPTVAP